MAFHFETHLWFVMDGEPVQAMVEPDGAGRIRMEVDTEDLPHGVAFDRARFQAKLPLVLKRCPELSEAGYTEMWVETKDEAEAREEAEETYAAKTGGGTPKIKAKTPKGKAKTELAEVRNALQKGKISRAKLQRVLVEAFKPNFVPYGLATALKKIL